MMRTALITPSKDDFFVLFDGSHFLKRGGGLSDITTFQSPIVYQKGGGLFSFLKGIGKRALPFIMKNVVPEALELGKGVFNDITSGQGQFKDSLKRRGMTALKGVAHRATVRGGRIKKKAKRAKKKNKWYKADVFA